MGLFGLPITLAIIKDLNDHGKIHVFKPYKPKDEEMPEDKPDDKGKEETPAEVKDGAEADVTDNSDNIE